MIKTKKLYYLAILILTFLLYNQSIGLNALLIALLSIAYVRQPVAPQDLSTWWVSAGLWTLTGVSLLHSHTTIGGTLYILMGLHFLSLNAQSAKRFPFTIMSTIATWILGIGHFFDFKRRFNQTETKDTHQQKTLVKNIFIYTIPFLILILFFKLYQLANPDFKAYTEFLNLRFIEWQFVLLYIVLMILAYGLYNYTVIPSISTLDEASEDVIYANYEDGIQNQFGLENENKMAFLLIGSLTILLVAFLVVDIQTLYFNANQTLTHSEYVHQGVNTLITSIIFVILIIAYVFRGGINFIKNDNLKVLTYLWLVLNIILTLLNAVKNWEYIQAWGLTHKRIGVFIYLLLCIIGLVFTIYKVSTKRSLWFLIRRVSFSFMAILSLYSVLNWNKYIAQYNLNDQRFRSDKIDFRYNIALGPEAYPFLLNYVQTHPNTVSAHHRTKLDNAIHQFKSHYLKSWSDFPSFKWSDWQVFKALEGYDPLYTPYPNYSSY